MKINWNSDSMWLKILLFVFILAIFAMVAVYPNSCLATTFRWSAPTGDPVEYDMRLNVDSVALRSNWSGSSVVPNMPVPSAPGMEDSVSFAVATNAFFAVKSVSLAGNWSGLSNIISVAPVVADPWVPSGTHRWYNKAVDSTRIHGGGPPQNYFDGTTWKKTDLTWVVRNGNLINTTNNHRSRINGTTNISEYEFEGHIIKQKPFALFAYRRSTHQRVMLDNSPDFSNRSFLDSIVTYTDIFPGVDLKVYVRLEEMSFKWVFHQSARDAFDTWWSAHGSPADAYLVTAFRFDLSAMGNMTLHDATGDVDLTVDGDIDGVMSFQRDGIEKFVLHKSYLDQTIFATPPADPDSIIQFPIYSRIVKISGARYLLEGIKWTDARQIPAGDISHNATFGNENPGAAQGHISSRTRGNTIGSPSSAGTLTAIRLFLSSQGTAGSLRMAISNASNHVILDSTVEIGTSTLGAWNEANVHIGITLSTGTSYELWGWGNSDERMVSGGTGASGHTRWTNLSETYNSQDWTSPQGTSNPTSNEQYRIVAIYTISGGGPDPSTRRRKVLLGGR